MLRDVLYSYKMGSCLPGKILTRAPCSRGVARRVAPGVAYNATATARWLQPNAATPIIVVLAIIAGCVCAAGSKAGGETEDKRSQAQRVERPLILNGGLERLAGGAFSTAPAWRLNTWGENTSYFSEETNDVHGGTSCQRIEVTALIDGGVVLCQRDTGPSLKAGKKYLLELWLRGNESAGTATVWVRDANWKPLPSFSRTFPVTTRWRKFRLTGTVERDLTGNIAIQFMPERAGVLWVDDVRLTCRGG